MATKTADPPSARKRILIVEDDPDVRHLIALTLSEYKVTEACDGQDALEAMGAMSMLPDAIILDGMMPRVDGPTFATFLKSRRDVCQIPIIMLSARNEAKDVARGIGSGVRHYMTKPFKRDDLRARVKKLFG